MRVLLPALLLLLACTTPAASAATTHSCTLVGHGTLLGVRSDDGCTVSGVATSEVLAVVSVTSGTIDAIEIEMLAPGGARHVFLCTYQVTSSMCLFPVQLTDVIDGTWVVTGRIVAADPLGPVLFGGADTYARLDVTFT